MWVRTRDWVAPWKAAGAPGKFQVRVNGQPLSATFGVEGEAWHWQDGGTVEVAGDARVALHDLTGFERAAATPCCSAGPRVCPARRAEPQALENFRRAALGLPDQPDDGGAFDLVVVGGIAGTAAAVGRAPGAARRAGAGPPGAGRQRQLRGARVAAGRDLQEALPQHRRDRARTGVARRPRLRKRRPRRVLRGCAQAGGREGRAAPHAPAGAARGRRRDEGRARRGGRRPAHAHGAPHPDRGRALCGLHGRAARSASWRARTTRSPKRPAWARATWNLLDQADTNQVLHCECKDKDALASAVMAERGRRSRAVRGRWT